MKPTPDWLVERLAADDLPEPEARSVRARLKAENAKLSGSDAKTSWDAERP